VTVLLWTVVPLGLLHVLLWRWWREVFRFQLLVDLVLLVVVGPALVQGGDLNPVRVLEASEPFSTWQFSDRTTHQPTQSDLVLQFHPWWAEARRQMAAGEPPWISDRIGGGMPLFAHGQTGLWAPMMAPVWLLGPERGTTVMALWKLELAALGAFLMLRMRWRVRWHAAALGGVVWGSGAFQVAWLLVPLSWVTALLPWLWWWTAVALDEHRRIGSLLGLGVAMGWLLGCGLHPEMAVIVVGSCVMAGLIFNPGRWRRLAVVMLVAVPVAVALSLPTLAAIGSSAKAHQLRDQQPNREPIPADIRLAAARQLVIPLANGRPGRGDWHQSFPYAAAATSVGGAALVLVAAGGIRRRYRPLMWAALASVAVAAVLAYRVPPLDALLVRAPPLDRMTLPRFAVLAPWGLALLAALSVDGYERRLVRGRLWPWLVALGVFAVAIVSRPWLLAPVNTALVGVTVVAAGLCAAVVQRSRLGVLLVVTAELALCAVGVNPVADARDRLPTPPLVSTLVELQSREPGRILGLEGVLPANTASRYGLRDLRAYDPVRPWPFAAMMARLGEREPTLGGPLHRAPAGLCGAWSVKHLVTPAWMEAEGWDWRWGNSTTSVWVNPRWLPEVRVVGRARRFSEDEGWARLMGDEVDHSVEAILPEGSPEVRSLGFAITDRHSEPGSVRVVTECDGPCLVVVARPWAPGWRATVDGKRVPVVRANLAGLGAIAPAGQHTVEIEYHPWGW
jgi:hypothetical protein